MKLIVFLIIAYIIGSVNFSIILFKLLGKDDPRDNFSGNPGTTNVYRQAGIKWALVVLLLDMGRAIVLAVLVDKNLTQHSIPWAGFMLIVGNRFPLFHHFKGGKGVANYLGFVAALAPLYAVFACVAWLGTFFVCRTPFIASFIMVFFLSIGMVIYCRHYNSAIWGTLCILFFIIFNHKSNILNLVKRKKAV